ncbi:MAG TPA: HAMP domain-containing sensor histidine kinase [Thermodesulfobacteriota bacterium]|nr:HAMP domain-containing sensor histidine kinase [Thermodesulfobacteriota bacterium]
MLRKLLGKREGSREQNERQIQEAAERDHLFHLLIHDLTGPLSIASATTKSLLKRREPLVESQKRLVERIQRNVEKAQNLLREMITISHSKEGLFTKEQIGMKGILRDSLCDVLEMNDPETVEKLSGAKSWTEVRRILRGKGIHFEVDGRYSEAPFCHDGEKIRQILRNLISNAMKYRRSETWISVYGEEDLIVSVRDDGIGIPVDAQEEIFKRFVRVRDERRGDVAGYGLGLPGVKSLVEAMGGEINLESRGDSGTCFTVRIPPLQT